jgi:hypothetical protein
MIPSTDSLISLFQKFGPLDTFSADSNEDDVPIVSQSTETGRSVPFVYDAQELYGSAFRACVQLGWNYFGTSLNHKISKFCNTTWLKHLRERDDLNVDLVTNHFCCFCTNFLSDHQVHSSSTGSLSSQEKLCCKEQA